MASINDILSTIQNGVVAANNLSKQMTGSFNNIAGQLSNTVKSFNGRTGIVLPIQGDYPTNLIPGSTTNDNAIAGNIGEYISSIIPSTTPIAIASAATTNLTSINISAGDWDIKANLGVIPSSAIQVFIGNISSASAAFGDLTFASVLQSSGINSFQSGGRMSFPLSTRRISVAASTTFYAIAQITGSSGAIYGFLDARRVR